MKKMIKLRQKSGFTLIEVMISLTILSLIMGVILGGFRLGNKSWQKGEQRLDEQQRMRCVFSILIQDIKSCLMIQRPSDPESTTQRRRTNQPVVFIGETDSIKFISTASGIAPQLKKGTLRLVKYLLSQDEDKPGLILEESPLLYQNPFEEDIDDIDSESIEFMTFHWSLYQDVTDTSFQYFGIKTIHQKVKELDKEPEWHDDWNTLEEIDSDEYCKNLPEKVRVTITRKSEDEEQEISISFEIPIVVGERQT